MFFLLLALQRPIARLTATLAIGQGVLTGWLPGYLLLSGAARLLAEVVRINPHVLLGLTEAQLIGIVSIILGVALILRDAFHPAVAPSDAPVGSESAVLSSHPVGR